MNGKIIITGAAGLVGQNVIVRLKAAGHTNLVGIDKHPVNTDILAKLHPDITVIKADLAKDDGWQHSFEGAETLIQMHAQIGGLDKREFEANNVTASERVLAAAKSAGIGHIVHASSSVVNSLAVDFYTETKKAQEKLVLDCGIPTCILRPTLMFGWFDRKHMGWLARFMKKVPVFPVPGRGQYIRQPLYVGDFARIILSAVESKATGIYNISGQERVRYLDMIKALKAAAGAKAMIVRIPYRLFHWLLAGYALVDKNPPFTTRQLEALVIPEEFEVIDWPGIFKVPATPLAAALHETHNDPRYSGVVLEF